MRILKSPQIHFDGKQFEFSFSGEAITVTFDSTTDTFDFTGLPDGELDFSRVETTLPYNPIIRAERVAGVLSVELLHFIPEDAPAIDKFPEWIEV